VSAKPPPPEEQEENSEEQIKNPAKPDKEPTERKDRENFIELNRVGMAVGKFTELLEHESCHVESKVSKT